MRVAVLFGAGASFRCSGVLPKQPPLGSGLLKDLVVFAPETWGSLQEEDRLRFEDDFENGMSSFYASDDFAGLQTAMLLELGLYFAGYGINYWKGTTYTKLYELLYRYGLTKQLTLISLNYECIAEQSWTAWACEKMRNARFKAFRGSSFGFEKPHGSCNFLLAGLSMNPFGGPSVAFGTDGGISGLEIDEVESYEVVRRAQSGELSVPPAMSVYTAGKPNPYGDDFITESRKRTESALAGAEIIISIGARVNFADVHIWDPIRASESEVLLIGGTEGDFTSLQNEIGNRLVHVHNQFEPGLAALELEFAKLDR